jgi:hypothetical protein
MLLVVVSTKNLLKMNELATSSPFKQYIIYKKNLPNLYKQQTSCSIFQNSEHDAAIYFQSNPTQSTLFSWIQLVVSENDCLIRSQDEIKMSGRALVLFYQAAHIDLIEIDEFMTKKECPE